MTDWRPSLYDRSERCTILAQLFVAFAHRWCGPKTDGPVKIPSHRLCFTPMYEQIVIVGAGQAAFQAIDTLRRKGFTGKLAVVGDEPWLPYQRPPLSKKYLAGALERERLLIRPEHFYTEHSVQTYLGRRVEEIA